MFVLMMDAIAELLLEAEEMPSSLFSGT